MNGKINVLLLKRLLSDMVRRSDIETDDPFRLAHSIHSFQSNDGFIMPVILMMVSLRFGWPGRSSKMLCVKH